MEYNLDIIRDVVCGYYNITPEKVFKKNTDSTNRARYMFVKVAIEFLDPVNFTIYDIIEYTQRQADAATLKNYNRRINAKSTDKLWQKEYADIVKKLKGIKPKEITYQKPAKLKIPWRWRSGDTHLGFKFTKAEVLAAERYVNRLIREGL